MNTQTHLISIYKKSIFNKMTHITSESNNSDYWTVGTKIIFKPHFNDILEKYHVLMQNYSEIYFSNYEDFDTFIKIHENSCKNS